MGGSSDLHAQQAAHGRVHGDFPQLRRVHLSQALVTLPACASVFGGACEVVWVFVKGWGFCVVEVEVGNKRKFRDSPGDFRVQ